MRYAAAGQVIVGDMLKLEKMEEAAKGAQYLFFCFPVTEGLLEATTIAAISAQNAGMRGIVNLSQWCAKLHSHSPYSRKHALSEAVRALSLCPYIPSSCNCHRPARQYLLCWYWF